MSPPRAPRHTNRPFGDMAELGRSHGLRPAIWSDDHPPPHVHFFCGRGKRHVYAQIMIATGAVRKNTGVPARMVRIAQAWMAQQRTAFQRAWDDVHTLGIATRDVPSYRAHKRHP